MEVATVGLSEFSITNPAMTDNGFTGVVCHPLFGDIVRHGPIVTLSATPGVIGTASLVGEHTRKVLTELGYADEEIENLRSRGLVSWPDSETVEG